MITKVRPRVLDVSLEKQPPMVTDGVTFLDIKRVLLGCIKRWIATAFIQPLLNLVGDARQRKLSKLIFTTRIVGEEDRAFLFPNASLGRRDSRTD
jgi:hypothetical protein